MAAKILALFYLAYDREPPTGAERTAKISTWALALQDIPVTHILPLAQQEIRERTSEFMPVPADLIRRYNGSDAMTPQGAENAAAYLPYRPVQAPALPAASAPLQISPEELKQRLKRPPAIRLELPQAVPLPKSAWSGFLIEFAEVAGVALDKCSPEERRQLEAFEDWWMINRPKRSVLACNVEKEWKAFAAGESL